MSRTSKPSRFFSYPYKFIQGETGKIPYPILPVHLFYRRRIIRLEFVMDTGADVTTLPFYVAEDLRINLSKLVRSSSQGISNQPTQTWETKINLRIADQTIRTRCSFVNTNKIPPLLGKLDIFDKFNFYFDNDHDELVLEIRK